MVPWRRLRKKAHYDVFLMSANVVREFPQFPVVRDYDGLRAEIDRAFARR